ncbi:MAG TPA: orotate phosphoribosyltransferase [Actinopolymorphaceae bacterium]
MLFVSDRERLLDLIKQRAIEHGEFVLSSGRTSNYYIDLRRITLDGEAAPLVGRVMRELTADLEYEAVGGLTLGADPIAAAMLHAAAAEGRTVDAFVVRKAEKAHGAGRRIEGPDVRGRRVLADRDTGARARLEEAGLPYRYVYGVEELGLAGSA